MMHTYLTFDGNCREAMNFYRQCLDGQLTLQTVGESPMADRMPKKMQDCILHATLSNDNLVLMASDMVADNGLVRGNAVSLLLNGNSEDEIRKWYDRLGKDGLKTHPIELTFWGALFGGLTDKFGNPWLLYYEQKNNL
jgi:PhnB protein